MLIPLNRNLLKRYSLLLSVRGDEWEFCICLQSEHSWDANVCGTQNCCADTWDTRHSAMCMYSSDYRLYRLIFSIVELKQPNKDEKVPLLGRYVRTYLYFRRSVYQQVSVVLRLTTLKSGTSQVWMAICGMTVVTHTVKETMAVAIMLTSAGRMVVRNGNSCQAEESINQRVHQCKRFHHTLNYYYRY